MKSLPNRPIWTHLTRHSSRWVIPKDIPRMGCRDVDEEEEGVASSVEDGILQSRTLTTSTFTRQQIVINNLWTSSRSKRTDNAPLPSCFGVSTVRPSFLLHFSVPIEYFRVSRSKCFGSRCERLVSSRRLVGRTPKIYLRQKSVESRLVPLAIAWNK